ncbi:hypothetical protein CDAR_378061 [Caerostris darwini]|uniref:Uncharacterized protein n=1 Tax=Caerostris darwini TaxID=1538125 RepID=A0AAV4PF93_9ARAC|nr:hypothetical protein CDAR_378061 [Caerostris darwini]
MSPLLNCCFYSFQPQTAPTTEKRNHLPFWPKVQNTSFQVGDIQNRTDRPLWVMVFRQGTPFKNGGHVHQVARGHLQKRDLPVKQHELLEIVEHKPLIRNSFDF